MPRAILYAAADPTSAVAEVFQAARVIDRTSQAPELVAFTRTGDLRLLDLSPGSEWPRRAGAAVALQFSEVDACQQWSRAIHEAYPAIQGLTHLSTLTGRRCFALFERATAGRAPPAPEAAALGTRPGRDSPGDRSRPGRLADRLKGR